MKSQNTLILNHLQKGKKITPLGALWLFNCFRLASRVSELRAQGHKIKSKLVRKGEKFVAEYSIEKPFTETKRFKRLAKEYLKNDDLLPK